MKLFLPVASMVLAFIFFLFQPVVTWAGESDPAAVQTGSQQKKVGVLEEVVVSATLVEATLLETPGTVNIFTAEDIEKGGYVDVADVINSLPGITNSSTNPGMPKYNFRGTAYAHSRGATVYVDGREVTSGRIGYGDINYVDLNDVAQIQVMKTPGAQFSEPSRGIIYITTKQGRQQGHHQRLKGQYGSWGLHKESGSAWGRVDAVDYRMSVMNQGGEGYRRTEDERQRINVRTGYALSEHSRIGIGAGYQNQEYLSNTALKKWQWDRDPRDNTPDNSESSPTYTLLPYKYDVEIHDIFTELNIDKKRWFTKSLLSFRHNDTDYFSRKYQNRPSYAGGNDTSTYLRDYDEDRLTCKGSGGYRWQNNALYNILTMGVEYDDHNYDQVRTYPFLTTPDATRQRYMQQYDLEISIDRVGIFVNNDLSLDDHVGLQTALRYDDVKLTFANQYVGDPDVENRYHKISWNISPAYRFSERDNLYLTISQSYFYPNIDYTRMSAQKDDAYPENDPGNLKPEDILTWEIGYKHKVNRAFNYSVAVYHMMVDDKFVFQYRYDAVADDWDSLGAVNLGRTVHQGLELEVDGWITDWLNYRFNYGYLKAIWDDPDATYSSYTWEADPADDERQGMSIDGKTLYRTPEHKVSVGLTAYPVDDLITWLSVIYVDDQYVDYMERVVQPSVVTVDFKAAYKMLQDRLTIHGLVKNLTGENYAYYSNAAGKRNSDGSLDTNYYVYPGRYFEVGLTMDF